MENNIDSELQEKALVNQVESKYPDRQIRFYIYQVMGKQIKDASRLCGYSEGYGYQLSRKMKNDPKWLGKIKPVADSITAEYKIHHKLALPALWDIKLSALEEMKRDASAIIRNPKLVRDFEQIAGAIEDERAIREVVNVDKMQIIIQGALGMKDTIEGEVVSDE